MQSAGPAWILRALAAPVLVAVALLLASQIPGAAASPPERTPPRFGDEIVAAYPYLEKADISAALAYAAWRVEEIEVALERR